MVAALAGSARAQEALDGGLPPEEIIAPQAEDREQPPVPPGKRTAPPATEKPLPPPKPTAAQPEAPPPPEPAAPVEPPSDKPRLTVYVYDEEHSTELADTVEEAMNDLLAGDQRLRFRRLIDILEKADEVARELGEADLALIDSEDAFAQGDIEKAKSLLEIALTRYAKRMPEMAKRGGGLEPFRDAWIKMARARFFDGDQKGAREAMRYVFVIDPHVKFNTTLFPLQMKKLVVEARLLFDTLGNGTLYVDSDPPGAVVYMNGQPMQKRTPTDAIESLPGPNYISFRRRGWAPATGIFEVAGGGDQASAVRALERHPGNPLKGFYRARLDLDKPEAPPTLKDATTALGVDMAILVRVTRADADEKGARAQMVAYLYDARLGKILKKSEETASEASTPEVAQRMVKWLLEGTRLDGKLTVAAPPPKKSSAAENWAKFRKSKAFWPVVGGVLGAVVVGATVGLAVGLSPRGLSPGEQVILLGGR